MTPSLPSAPPPWSILSLQGLGPPALACTYQHCSQRGWTVQTLNSYLLQGKQTPLSPPLIQCARHRASPFYAFSKFSNMLLSVAALVVIISLGSWPLNTLFIVNCKTVYPLKLFFFFLIQILVLLEFFLLGKSLPAPLRDATTPSVDGLCGDLAWCHGTGAHSPDVKVISRPCFVSCIPFTSSWVKPHELTGS